MSDPAERTYHEPIGGKKPLDDKAVSQALAVRASIPGQDRIDLRLWMSQRKNVTFSRQCVDNLLSYVN
jgi:hypothetical protein